MNTRSGRRILDMAAPALVFAAVFLWLRAANQTPDGLSYALSVRTGVDMFHPHHLIYVPVARLIHLAAGIDPITATLWQNLFWVIVLGFAGWRLAGRIFPGRLAPVLAAVGLLSLRGVMIYSVRVETYLPAVACLVLAAALAGEHRRVRLGVIPVLALAILYHQTNVLFVAPLAVLLWEGRSRASWGILGFVAAAGILVLVPYLAAASAREPGAGFWAFALDYARAPIEAWGSFDHFSPAGFRQLTLSQARMIVPVREGAAFVGSLFMAAGLVVLTVWHLVLIRRGADHVRLRVFGLGFLVVYLLFFLWWMPSDTDFFVATLLPLWLLVLILLTDLPAAWRKPPAAVFLVLALAAGNLWFTIVPMHRDPGPGRAMAHALDGAAAPEAAFVVGYAVQQEMLYFTGRTAVLEAEGLVREVSAGRASAPGKVPVVVEGPYLRSVLQAEDEAGIKLLKLLVKYDPRVGDALTIDRLDGADALVLGPARRQVPSWPGLVTEVEAKVRP